MIYKYDIFEDPACGFYHEDLSVLMLPLQKRDENAELFNV
jgi:hypothetical protein